MLDVFSDPQMRHAALVHLPVALAMLGLIPAALSLIAKLGRTPVVVTLSVYVLLIAAAWGGVLSGESAESRVGALPHTVSEQIHEHEEAAEKIWYFALAASVLCLGGLAKSPRFAKISKVATLLAAAGGAGWTAYSSHLGGSLVYDFGVGTPNPVTIDDIDPQQRITLADPRAEYFISTVYPLLYDRCMACHTVGDRPDADLDLSTPAGLLAGGESGPAIVPGDPDASLLFQTVTGDHPDIFMPEGDDPLKADELEVLRQWIAQGAVWAEKPAAAPAQDDQDAPQEPSPQPLSGPSAAPPAAPPAD